MDLQEVKAYLEENKDSEEVKTYLSSFKVEPTLEVFKGKLNDADFKSWLDSEKDKHSSKSLETWKSNNLSKLIDEEVKKRYPDADPKDVELKKLQIEIEKIRAEATRKELTNKALKIATDKKLPIDLMDFFLGDNEESTIKNIEKLEQVYSAHIESMVNERLKGGYQPPRDDKGGNDFTNLNPMQLMSKGFTKTK